MSIVMLLPFQQNLIMIATLNESAMQLHFKIDHWIGCKDCLMSLELISDKAAINNTLRNSTCTAICTGKKCP